MHALAFPRTVRRYAGLGWLAALSLLVATGAHALEVGQKAPDFVLQGSDGKTYVLGDFVGERGVVLAWFPAAFTPGCTRELESLRDGADLLAAFDAAVFMVSTDPPEKNAAFAKSLGAKHVLLSDPDGGVAAVYGVARDGGFANRWTFYIDREGVLREIDRGVETGTAAQDIARRLDELGFPKRAP